MGGGKNSCVMALTKTRRSSLQKWPKSSSAFSSSSAFCGNTSAAGWVMRAAGLLPPPAPLSPPSRSLTELSSRSSPRARALSDSCSRLCYCCSAVDVIRRLSRWLLGSHSWSRPAGSTCRGLCSSENSVRRNSDYSASKARTSSHIKKVDVKKIEKS